MRNLRAAAENVQPGHAASEREPLLAIEGLDVSYGSTRALIGAGLTVCAGEIHALIGENGCGKSTLVKTISGIVKPSAGTLRWHGKDVVFSKPREAQAAGIVTVYQETLVADELTVLDNLRLGIDDTFKVKLRRSAAEGLAREHLDELGLSDVRFDTPLWQLPLSRRHLVAIARALMRPWALLLLDEATAALDLEDRGHLFAVIRRAVAQGRGILYISHRMDEIENLANRVTVLRSGRTVGTLQRHEIARRAVLDLMSPPTREVRERADLKATADSQKSSVRGEVVLRAEGVQLEVTSRPLDLDIARGEVIGLAGLEGHGQVAFLRCLAGWQKPYSGKLSVSSADTLGAVQVRSADQMLANGVAYVPGDRKREGIFGSLSVLDNLMLPSMGEFSVAGLIDLRREKKRAADLVKQMLVKSAGLESSIESLSGGNQQKVVLGRWIATNARVLLLEDPMRGVDANSKGEIVGVLSSLVNDGVTLVLLSTEVEELVDLCHRVVVFREQTIFEVIPRAELTEQAVVGAMLGHRGTEGAAGV